MPPMAMARSKDVAIWRSASPLPASSGLREGWQREPALPPLESVGRPGLPHRYSWTARPRRGFGTALSAFDVSGHDLPIGGKGGKKEQLLSVPTPSGGGFHRASRCATSC